MCFDPVYSSHSLVLGPQRLVTYRHQDLAAHNAERRVHKNDKKKRKRKKENPPDPPPVCLNEELDVALEVAVVMVVVVSDAAEAVWEDPHLHGAVGAAREDVVGRPHFDLHDAGAQVPEE